MEYGGADVRLAAHYSLVEVLAGAGTVEEATPQLLAIIGELFGWELGALWVIDPRCNALRWAEHWVAPGVDLAEFEESNRDLALREGEGLPGSVWASGEPEWVRDVTADPRFLRLEAATAAGLHAWVGLPVFGRSSVIGVIEFFASRIREPDAGVLAMLRTLGRQVGQFLERRRAEEQLARSQAITSAIVASALDCVITMDSDGRVVDFNPAAERTFGYSREQAIGRVLAELIIPPQLRDAHRAALARFLETGEGRILDQRLELSALRADGHEFPVELTVTAIATPDGPMFAGYLRDITDRISQEREVAAVLDRERRIALTLQRSLLPPHLPKIEGLELAAAFQAAGDGSIVGGDFYDVFDAPAGWSFVIGDVCGKGPEAAAATALARYTLRAGAMTGVGPSEILRLLNDAFLQERAADFCTAAYAALRRNGPGFDVCASIGGHPLPLVVRRDGTVEAIGSPGTLLGALPNPDLSDESAHLAGGDALVLYTDGVIEARHGDGRFGTERLRELLRECAGMPARRIASAVESAVAGEHASDDVAVIVVRAKG